MGIITSAALNPLLTPTIIAILDFYIEEVNIHLMIPLQFDTEEIQFEGSLDIWQLMRPRSTDILILWFYLIVIKIVFIHWINPVYRWMIERRLKSQ